jgi:ATP-dependent DNA helicase RecG
MDKKGLFKESEKIELKKSTSELKEAIEAIVGILNKHKKGDLYFGIRDDGVILGQSISDATLREISKAISDYIEPKIFPKIQQVSLNGKDCVKVEFEGKEVPYFAFGRAYLRTGTENKKISAKELENLILDKNRDNFSWDKEISKKSMGDVNSKLVKEFIKKANEAKRINFGFTNIKEVLNKLGLLKNKKLFSAVDILFCDKNSLEIQVAVFAGTDKTTFLDIKQLKGNIFELLNESETYIKEHIDWRAELKDRERKEIPEVPIRAITEALVNSLCHRDYVNPKANEVAIFKDRIEIYNPGQFPEGYEPKDFLSGKERSILRNPLIANTLYLSRDIERWGSGLKRINDVCREANVKVEFQKIKSGFLVVFYRKKDWGEDRVGEKVGEKVGENEYKILDIIRENSSITYIELSEILGMAEKNIYKNIEKLKQKGLLRRVGPAKGGYWEVLK